ncbi:MAG: hypothetical protein ABIV63_06435 [Caldimonas sp.]
MNHNRRMYARLSAFVIWALIAATVVFWGLRLFVHATPAPGNAVAVGGAVSGGGDLTRLLGAPPVAAQTAIVTPDAGARFHLLGIMAPRRAVAGAKAQGVALIAVDGKPPRAYAVGAHLDSDLVLQSVSLRTASIGRSEGAQTLLLEIPRLPAAATGTLPPFGSPVPSAPGVSGVPGVPMPHVGAVGGPMTVPPIAPAAGPPGAVPIGAQAQ